MTNPPPTNRRRAPVPSSDDASPPPPTATTVRPPPGPAGTPKPRSAFWRIVQLSAGVVVVLAASIAVGWGARRYLLSSPRFAIRTVLVDGANRRSAEQIASLGGVQVGSNIFALDLESARARIINDAWIDRATVKRELPATVAIAVVEREAKALVAIGGDLYLATRDGEPFKRIAEGDPTDYPIVTGILPDQIAADRAGAVLSVKRLLDVAEDMDHAGMTKTMPLQELHLERDGSVVATLGKDALIVHLGHPPYRTKIEQGARALSEIARRRANASVIFLDNDAHPERVVVRMR